MDEIRYDLGDGLAVRELRASDPDELYALVVTNHAHLAPWMPWAVRPDIGETRTYVAGALAQRARNDGFGAVILAGEAIIGSMGFHRVDWINRATSMGYWLDAGHQGRGIVTRAVAALIDHAFTAWPMHRVEIDAAPDNVRSRAVPERLGFVHEGVRRDGERFGDAYRDLVVYSMLEPDWRS